MYVRLYEVGPRDGLQIMPHFIDVEKRVKLINLLLESGLKYIEVGSCVSPKVPAMQNSENVASNFSSNGISLLIPNKKGLERAKNSGVKRLNITISANEEFNKANLGRNMEDSLSEYENMLDNTNRGNIRAYISHAFEENDVIKTDRLVKRLSNIASTIVLADTKGNASPKIIKRILKRYNKPSFSLGIHLHNGKADIWKNVEAAYECGIRDFDTSIAGFGGCPFVDGAKSNLSTEEMVNWCNKRAIPTGIDMKMLQIASDFMESIAETTSCTTVVATLH